MPRETRQELLRDKISGSFKGGVDKKIDGKTRQELLRDKISGSFKGGVAELTEKDKEELKVIKEERNRKNREAVKGRPPTPEERQLMEELREDRVKRSNPSTNLKRGGKVRGVGIAKKGFRPAKMR